MNDRIRAVGSNLILRAEGYKDIQVVLNGDSMSSGDGSAQIYFAYVKNIKDMVSGIKYRIVDTTGHWVADGVFVERPAGMDGIDSIIEEVPFSFDKTTINEAFWSGDVPKTLPKHFVDFYRQQGVSQYSKSRFFISIEEWEMGNISQMMDRIKIVGGKLKLRAKGYKDIDVILDGSNITSNLGDAQIYVAYVQNEWDLVSGVKYDIIDETGYWVVKEGVYVLRPENKDQVDFDYGTTTITEAFWSGELPRTLPVEFVEFYKQQPPYRYDPALFFINIKEWDFTQNYVQLNERLKHVGNRLLLRAEGHKDILVEINGNTMSSGDGRAQLYEVTVINPEDMVSGVKYRIIDETGHWIVNSDVFVERPY